MSKCLTILILFFTFSAFAQDVKRDTIFIIQKETNSNKLNFDQGYVNYLKEINDQSQKRYDNNLNSYNLITGIFSGLIGVASLFFIVIAFLGFTEFKKIKKQSKEIEKLKNNASINEQKLKEMVDANNTMQTNLIRERASNKILHDKIDTFYRLKEYEIADGLMSDLMGLIDKGEEDEEFKSEIILLNGRIKYQRGEYEKSVTLLREIKKVNHQRDIKKSIFVNDLIGANNHHLFKKNNDIKLCDEALECFQTAFDLTNDNYDKKRFLSNIQVTYGMLNDCKSQIKIYKKTKGIEIGSNTKGEEQDKKLEIGIYINGAFAMWIIEDNECYNVADEMLGKYNTTFADLRDYLIDKIKVNSEELDNFISDYNKFKKA